MVHGTGDRVKAVNALLGCAIGDSLGLPFENGRSSLPAEWAGTSYAQSSPRWSDDTQQSLVLLDEALRVGRLDAYSVMERFALMWRQRPPANPVRGLFGLHRGTGRGFRHAVENYALTGKFSPMPGRAGNGAAMRIAAVAVLLGPSRATREQIIEVSCATHAVVESIDAALAVAEAAWALLRGEHGTEAIVNLVEALPSGAVRDALAAVVGASSVDDMLLRLSGKTGFPAGAGHALGSPLAAVVLATMSGSLHEAVVAAVRLGGDTDSTAAIAGALRAAIEGVDRLPAGLLGLPGLQDLARWRDSLPRLEEWLELERRLCST